MKQCLSMLPDGSSVHSKHRPHHRHASNFCSRGHVVVVESEEMLKYGGDDDDSSSPLSSFMSQLIIDSSVETMLLKIVCDNAKPLPCFTKATTTTSSPSPLTRSRSMRSRRRSNEDETLSYRRWEHSQGRTTINNGGNNLHRDYRWRSLNHDNPSCAGLTCPQRLSSSELSPETMKNKKNYIETWGQLPPLPSTINKSNNGQMAIMSLPPLPTRPSSHKASLPYKSLSIEKPPSGLLGRKVSL